MPTALPQAISAGGSPIRWVPARALENGVFLVYADLCGVENDLSYGGRSVILAPDGDELARAGMRETLLVAEVDTSAYADAKAQNPYFADRRPALYRLG